MDSANIISHPQQSSPISPRTSSLKIGLAYSDFFCIFAKLIIIYIPFYTIVMKQNRISLIATTIFIAIMVALMPVNTHAETPHAVPKQSEWIVPVFVPDITAIPEINTDNWLDLADLPKSSLPESAYQGFRLPHINAIYTWNKSVIAKLTAKCSVILIDYKEATAADLAALPIDHIVAIGICGPQARVITTSALTSGSNPALISADLMEFVAMAKSAGLI